MSFERPVALVLMGVLLSTGCTSMRPIAVAAANKPTYGQVMAGDTVIVQKPDGRRSRFVVEQIDGETIIARGGTRFPRQEIVRLWQRSFSVRKTAWLLAGIAVGVWLTVGFLSLAPPGPPTCCL